MIAEQVQLVAREQRLGADSEHPRLRVVPGVRRLGERKQHSATGGAARRSAESIVASAAPPWRSAARSLKNNTVKTYRTADELFELIRSGNADAIALGRESLGGMQAKLPGSRILDGHFQATGTAVAVPKGRPAALAHVSAWLDKAKKDGTVRKALDSAGLKDSPVAP